MKLKNKDNILLSGALFGLAIIGFTISYNKARNVNKKLDLLEEDVDTNFNEFAKIYNKSLDLQHEIYKDISTELLDVKDEIGVCYEHIEALSNKSDKSEEFEV